MMNIRSLYQNIVRNFSRWRASAPLLTVPLIALILPAVIPAFFAAKAELIPWTWGRCPAPNESQYCPVYSPEGQRFRAYIQTLIGRWIADHGLPPEELTVITTYGREDLTADINGYIAAHLLSLLEKAPDRRTDEEKFIVQMMQEHVRATEYALYDYAVKDAESFIRDPCGWKPDPEVAAAYGLEYDGSPYCGNRGVGVLFRFHIPGPKAEYLYAAAFKQTYGTFGQPLVAALMREKAGYHLAATASAVSAGGVAGGIVGKNISKFIPWLFKERYNGWSKAANNVFKARYTRFFGGGAFSVVTFMANIGIEAIIAFAEEVKFQEDLERFKKLRDSLATSADAVSILASEQGIEKAMFLANDYGLTPGWADHLPTHRPTVDRVFMVREGTVSRAHPVLPLKDHAEQVWNVEMWGSWFIRKTTIDSTKVESITADLQVTDFEGTQWIATRIGADRFRMTQVDAPENTKPCPSVNGISTRRDRSCSIYFSDNINIRLASGQNVNLNLGLAPRIQSSESYFFAANTNSSFPVPVTGQPVATLEIGARPSWLRVVDGALVGNPGFAAGRATVELRAKTESGFDSRRVVIYFGQPLAFSSAAAVSITALDETAFGIKTAGTPRPRLTLNGWLPPGFSFRDNGDGTGVVRGRWIGGLTPFCVPTSVDSNNNPVGCTTVVTATNGAQTIQQSLSFGFHLQPAARFSGAELKFVAGSESEYLLTTTDARTTVRWNSLGGVVLATELRRQFPWLSFEPQSDGTARVRGTPPMNGESTTAGFIVCPHADGSIGMICSAFDALKVVVEARPQFVSNAYTSTIAGSPARIPIIVNRLNGYIGFSPYQIQTSRIPKGMTLEMVAPQRDGKVTALLSGVPEPGQGGRYEFTLQWTDQLSPTEWLFTLDVLEPATITSADTFTFFEGQNAVGEVTTAGYPVNATGVDCGPGKNCADMSIRLQWGARSIAGLTLKDRNPLGLATGVGRFEGMIPVGAAGIYEATVIASNGTMAPPAQKPIRIVVRPAGDLNNDGTVDCQDLSAIKNAIGNAQFVAGQGFDLNGDMIVDEKDVQAMVRAIKNLWACLI